MAMNPKDMMAAALSAGGGQPPAGAPEPDGDEAPMDPSQASPYDLLDKLQTMAGGDPKIQDLLQQLFDAFSQTDQSAGPTDGNMGMQL